MIIGGLAASLLGRPRFTKHIDLIIFKSISKRPIDMGDIKAIVTRHPDLEAKRILSTIRGFADILEMPDLYQKIESLLK
jgi:hypothetical protein